MPGTISDAPSVSLSFANNFWGKEDAGVQPLLERMHNAKVTSDELKAFYNARSAIEDEYSRKLLTLCRKPLGSSEAGTLRASLDVMRGEVESMGKAHSAIAAQMKSELEEPLVAFAGGMKERRKIVQAGVEKLLKVKVQQTQVVNKSRDRYEQDCLRIKGYLAQGHMVMGQEERKNKAKLEKTQVQLAQTSNEYEAAVKLLEETTGRWNRDWKAACDKFQDLEEERLDFTKSSLWTFANIASTVCVSDDASCEKIRLSLESCEVEKDITHFIQERGTGQEIPDPPKYINFCRGDVNDTASETSEDDNYSVAQFQRTINPAFRSSSPQPSTYESHHDPQSELAARMGHPDLNAPPDDEPTIVPQKAPQPAPPLLDYRRQAQVQAQAHAQFQANQPDFAPVPHNEYPADGMTMFCRTDAPSERSSVTSPVRPPSRDSQSDYSNPTSFSSIEPTSGKASPTKQDQISMPPPISPNKQVQKKRSGFFSNSPFRRKSKHDKDGREEQRPLSMAPPASRNTWGPSNGRGFGSTNPSPTRPGTQARDFAGAGSHSPEPVDPRANFQLNVGPNVFDVASPDSHRKPQSSAPQSQFDELDPIAQALAELKGVGKQSSVRVSADRYHGIATPAPPGTPGTPAALQNNSNAIAAQRGTPPPSYHDQQPVKRLDLPQPAFTSKQMQQTTRKYTSQNNDMYGSVSRPGTRGGSTGGDIPPRATSPLPIRSTSPRPGLANTHQGSNNYNGSAGPRSRMTNGNQAPNGYNRSASPNPYAGRPTSQDQRSVSPNPYAGRPAAQAQRSVSPNPYAGRPVSQAQRGTSPNPYAGRPLRQGPGQGQSQSVGNSPVKQGYGSANGSINQYSRHTSPNDIRRAASPQPQPQYARPERERPASSAGAGGGGMALQLSNGDPGAQAAMYSGRNAAAGSVGRPVSYYAGDQGQGRNGGGGAGAGGDRVRSKSVVDARQQFTSDGRPILQFARAMYMYQAIIPQELSFAKGDVLAVLRLQDDGWWEAEVRGGNGKGGGRVGLVPSNYLQGL